MTSITGMRKLSEKYRLVGRSIREVYTGLKAAETYFADVRGLTFRDRKVGKEAIINAAVWKFLDMDRAQQERVLKTYLPRLETYLVGEDEADREPTGRAEVKSHDREESTVENRDGAETRRSVQPKRRGGGK